MKKVFFILGLFLLSISAVFAEDKVFVLCYHGFKGDVKNDYDLPKDTLREQIKILKDNGFKFVTYQDFKSGKISGSKNILVTIDDGLLTSYEAYKEIMKPEGIKPVWAIFPAIIGKSPKMYMNWEQVKEISAEGMEIAAHGYNHEAVNEKLYNKSKQKFEDEIYKSKSILEEKTGKKVEVFIYPFGIKSPVTVEYLAKAGYKYGFTIKWGSVLIPTDRNKSMLELPRYMLTQKEWKNEFKIILSNASK